MAMHFCIAFFIALKELFFVEKSYVIIYSVCLHANARDVLLK